MERMNSQLAAAPSSYDLLKVSPHEKKILPKDGNPPCAGPRASPFDAEVTHQEYSPTGCQWGDLSIEIGSEFGTTGMGGLHHKTHRRISLPLTWRPTPVTLECAPSMWRM